MKKAAYEWLLNWHVDGNCEDTEENGEGSESMCLGIVGGGANVFNEIDAISEVSQCKSSENHAELEPVSDGYRTDPSNLRQHISMYETCSKPPSDELKNGNGGEDQTRESCESSRQDPKIGQDKLEEHFLRASCVLEDLIDEELDRYRAHYIRPTDRTGLEDVAELLIPDWTRPLESASVGWLGDWRPTAMLALLTGLVRSSSTFSDPARIERTVSGLTREARIEEAIIDGELAEIQATCILNLPFVFVGTGDVLDMDAASHVCAELQKIKRVIAKAQQLRFRTLEMVVRKVPNPSDAAEFLMVFERIQRALHQFAAGHELRNGRVTFSVKRLGVLDST